MPSHYPAYYHFDDENDCWHIGFRDFPEFQTASYKREDIELEAQDALLTAIAIELDEGRTVPPPSSCDAAELRVPLSLLAQLKIALHNALLAQRMPKALLARKLGFNAGQMNRLLDIAYASKAEALEQALFLLGYEIRASVHLCDKQ
ncbi:hypothetical protein D781_3180 [Serratia sp. FGI94]|uniref:hypothetical protein n=1 Tax=Serratia sp. FGI94 TaxID=671990 RepID=UPI0002A702F4|nr:hypothetical protein [Serratia sp. FGI94]AGB83410.1 hypothetical protein D781_3180 [Serratia sp. FGI94]